MSGGTIFAMICNDRGDAAGLVADLSDEALRQLIGHLSRDINENSVAGEVLGIALVIAAGRWVKGKES